MTDNKKVSSTKLRSKSNFKEDKQAELAGKIDETDEMKLKMLAALDKPEPDDVLYPPELNAHLIEQLKIMTSENNELRKCVFTREQEIKELSKTVGDLNQRIRDIISGSGPAISSKSAGVISAKITDLCKQNRHLVAELEGFKTRNANLERKIMQLEISKEQEKLDICMCKDAQDASPDELKELNNKLIVVNKKLYDSKNRNLELKNDILIATKILQQELGDKFTSIKELQNDLAGWKGRAQQIVLLQSRVSELEEKLNLKQKDLIEASKRKDQAQVIREIEAKRKKDIDAAMKDYEVLKEENQELKKKFDGGRCRIRNLECDVTTMRQKMQTFVEKSNHDDMLVNEQRNQIKSLELYYQEILKENTSKMNKMQSELAEYQKLLKNTDAKIDALRKQASEKTTKIEELRAQLLRYEECSLQSVFFTPMKTATDNEIKKLSELVVILNDRLDAERHKWEELEMTHRKLKEKKKKLERKVASLEEEVKSLKESRRGSKISKSSLLKEQPHEFSMGSSITKKHSSISAVVAERPSESSSESQPPEGYDMLDKEDLKYKLELSEEKLKIMEDRLKMIEEEKKDDYNHLTEMIQSSKQLFNEALAVLQREKCLCS
ncbi:coiled-coil domain-containing protein 13 [Plodia interpunctella]|uniref:coiled-coil domain-containing protein 13 n=1 Tax=Plodia interpunctella TaxID=58824 RepID=UPI0023688540|nr:coiled-coil domain-containing protein 13 [Plodia interpunctella]